MPARYGALLANSLVYDLLRSAVLPFMEATKSWSILRTSSGPPFG
jgi:hypothetical protein